MAPLQPGTRFGGYTIEGFIARGGIGSVYAARDSVYGSAVALKILHPELSVDADWRGRFAEEALVGQQLKHPHVLSARDVAVDQDRMALVMDLVPDAQTLLHVMSREFPHGLPLTSAVPLFLSVVQGVEYAHGKGVVHGDLKPENVLIHARVQRDPSTWTPMVTDFGTVGLLANPVLIDGMPAVVASPRYASPEHVLGTDHLTEVSDIYCLGLLLFYLLTGTHASTASSVREAVAVVRSPVPVVALVDQPDAVVRVFQRCVAVDPAERYSSCRGLALDLRLVLDGLGLELPVEDIKSELATEIMEERQDALAAMDGGGGGGDTVPLGDPTRVTGEPASQRSSEPPETTVPSPDLDVHAVDVHAGEQALPLPGGHEVTLELDPPTDDAPVPPTPEPDMPDAHGESPLPEPEPTTEPEAGAEREPALEGAPDGPPGREAVPGYVWVGVAVALLVLLVVVAMALPH